MSGIIPPRVIEELLFRTDIVDLIGSYVPLKRAGSSFKACCPFHQEKTPSFTVNPQRQSFKCFGCGEGGDAITFLMKHEGMDFMTAARMLAQRAGVELQVEEDDGRGSHRQPLYDLHSALAAKYHATLRHSASAAAARDYLKERALTEETVEAFQIGYAPDRWDAVLEWGRTKGFGPDLLEEAGVILRKTSEDGTTHYYDRFRNRITFPILDLQARVIGFSARRLDSADQGAKYINSPETPIFQKGRILYAMDKARKPIADAQEALLCEGQIDVIRCHQAGFSTAVASQGTAFTDEHAHILKRYADSVLIVFDGDAAGQEASVKTARICLAAGLAVRVARLPESEDPDSFIRRQGPEAFQQVLRAAVSIVAFQIDMRASREPDGGEVKIMRTAREVLKTIQGCPSAILKATLLREAAERLGLPEPVLEEELRQMPPPPSPAPSSRHRTASAGATHGRRHDAVPEETADVPVERGAGPASETTPGKPPPDEIFLCEHLTRLSDEPELPELIRRYLPCSILWHPLTRRLADVLVQTADQGIPAEDAVERHLAAAGNEPAESRDAFRRFAHTIIGAPSRIRGIRTGKGMIRPAEASSKDAVQDLILAIWRRHIKARRSLLQRNAGGEVDAGQAERIRQFTHDLDSLKNWEHGSLVIELEMAAARTEAGAGSPACADTASPG